MRDNSAHTNDVIRRFILEELSWAEDPEVLTDDFPLVARHAIDSLDTLNLVIFVEQHFGITVPDAEITPENFGSLGAITKFVTSRIEA